MKKTLNRNILFSVFLAISIIFIGYYRGNFYDSLFNYIKCDSRESCLHESTHKYDYDNGNISQSKEFIQAVTEYREHAFEGYILVSQIPDSTIKLVMFPGIGRQRNKSFNPFRQSFYQGGWGGYDEIYASIVNYTDGNIPDEFQKFYNMEEINNTMKGLGY